jgi:hypothetical protein
MADVNVFKYISNVFTTIFNIIENKIKENNKPFKISLSEKQIKLIMMGSFLKVHCMCFG